MSRVGRRERDKSYSEYVRVSIECIDGIMITLNSVDGWITNYIANKLLTGRI